MEHGDSIVERLIELALDGDPAALKIAIDRLIPKSGDSFLQLTLNNVINQLHTENPILRQVVAAVEGQTISFNEATALVKLFNEMPDAADKSLKDVVERLNNTKRIYEQH